MRMQLQRHKIVVFYSIQAYENVLEKYYRNEYYSIGEKKPKTFNYRTYKDICRWEEENDGENK